MSPFPVPVSAMNKEIMIEVGKRIREVRKHLQVNQTDFARLIGIPIKQLSAMENGKIKPDFDFLYKAEEVFKVCIWSKKSSLDVHGR